MATLMYSTLPSGHYIGHEVDLSFVSIFRLAARIMSSRLFFNSSARSFLFCDHAALLLLDADADKSDGVSASRPGDGAILEDRL